MPTQKYVLFISKGFLKQTNGVCTAAFICFEVLSDVFLCMHLYFFYARPSPEMWHDKGQYQNVLNKCIFPLYKHRSFKNGTAAVLFEKPQTSFGPLLQKRRMHLIHYVHSLIWRQKNSQISVSLPKETALIHKRHAIARFRQISELWCRLNKRKETTYPEGC